MPKDITDYLRTIVPDPNGCLLWNGKITNKDTRPTPMLRAPKDSPTKYITARKAVWALRGGPAVPDGSALTVKCGQATCVNFDHLTPRTRADITFDLARDGKCMKGLHDMSDPANRAANGKSNPELCRACKNKRHREWRQAKDTRRILDELS